MEAINNWFSSLDCAVIDALELFVKEGLPKINLENFKRPLVIGSGNAIETGKIIFNDIDAIFANESTYEHALKIHKDIDGAVLISASGKKDAPAIGKKLKKEKLKRKFLTCNPKAPAAKFFDPKDVFVFPSLPEPYTYNVSTYLGMILAKTKEDPKKILEFIKTKVDKSIPECIGEHKAYILLIDKEHSLMAPMLQTKFIELFGRKFSRDVFTKQFAEVHATDIVPTPEELFISLGYKNKKIGEQKLFIPLPKNSGYGAVFAIAYYAIGKVQAAKEPFFKENIVDWSKRRGHEPIVNYR